MMVAALTTLRSPPTPPDDQGLGIKPCHNVITEKITPPSIQRHMWSTKAFPAAQKMMLKWERC